MKCFKDLNEKHIKILKEVEKNSKKIKQDVHLRDLLKEKMIVYDKKYTLTYKGYDHLALAYFKKKGLSRIIDQIDIGKESDIYLGEMNGMLVAVKMYRIGRTSYRRTENRDNIKMDMYKRSMMYCQREYKILRSLTSENIAMPVGCNRHVLITRYYECKPLVRTRLDDLDYFYNKLMNLVVDLYSMGYVHGDFNEYNVLINDKQIVLVDFPQCVPTTDPRAGEYLRKDVQCVKEYFERKYRYINERDVIAEIGAGCDQ